MAQGLSFLDIILAEALGAQALTHPLLATNPPPDNYFVLSNEQQAWQQFKEASKKENMVVCIEFVNEGLSRSTLFQDLARDHDSIPFIRVKVDEDDQNSFENVRKDVGGVTVMPSILVMFFDAKKTLRVKFEGVEEVIKGVRSDQFSYFIKGFMSRRVNLKKNEEEVQPEEEVKKQQLRLEYEEKMRQVTEEEEKAKEEAKREMERDDDDDELQSSSGRMRALSFLDVMLANALAAGLAHDRKRNQEKRPPDNYFVLSRDPEAWKKFKEDSWKENLVFCMEFIDEDMSTVFVDLAREFDSIPFVRVQVGVESTFEEVRKDIGGVDRTPSIVVVYFGKENNEDKKFRVKFGGIQEIQEGLMSKNLQKMIRELISRRVQLKQSEAVEKQVRVQVQDKEQQMREEYEAKMREVAELEDKLTKEKEDTEKLHQSASQVSNKMFSESMSPAELAEWLLEELGNEFKDDINKLRSNKINGGVFLQLPCEKESTLAKFDLSFGFIRLLPSKVKELKCTVSQETEKEFIDWKEDTERRILEFSESLGPNDLAFWLFQELGNDYKEDIEKLKENKINASLFLQWETNSVMVNDLGLTYGFKALISAKLKKMKEADETKEPEITESFCELQEPESPTRPQNDPLKITMNPSGQMKHCRQGTVLTVRASGPGTLSYQWIKDGEPLTDDSLPHCSGVMSDSLRFTTLLPEHSGSYKCRVSSSGKSLDSMLAKLEVPTTKKFTNFIGESSQCQDGHVTVIEILEERFDAYLQQYGYTFVGDEQKKEATLADIHKNAKVNYDEATIDFRSQKLMNKKVEPIGVPKEYTNHETEDRNEQFQRNVTVLVGSEMSKTSWSAWSTSAELNASHQGVGASAGVGYEKGKSRTITRTESIERTESFDECVLVPRETRVKVSVEKQVTVFKCNVSDLLVTFKKNKSQIKCKIQFGHKGQTKTETFKLKEIFKNDIISSDQKCIIIRMGGKYVWSETCVYLRRYDPTLLTRVPTSTSLEVHDPSSPGAHKIIQPVLSIYTGLSGVDVYGTTSVVVRNSSLQWHWDKFGVKVNVNDDSLPPDIKECHITINVSLSGHYKFPEDESLVSAVFWFRCDPPCKLAKPVTVEIQHCAPSDNVSSLSFVKAVCTQKERPYTFKHLEGGSFCKHSSFGIIELTSFSGLCIAQKGSDKRDYLVTLLYKEERFDSGLCFHLYFVITWNTETHYMVMKKYFDETKVCTNQRVVFKSDRVKFRLSYAPGENWTIICINSDVVEREAIDNFRPRKTSWIPHSQFKAKLSRLSVMTGGAPALHFKVDLHGAKGPQNKFTIDINPSLVADVLPYARQEQARVVPYSAKAKPILKELMRELRSKAAFWEDIGVELQIDDGVLAQIQRDKCGNSIDCLREMFRKWLVQVSPSWSAIAEAVVILGDEELAKSIRTRFC